MIKHLFLGIWVCVVSLGSAYGVMQWQMQAQAAHEDGEGAEKKVELEQLKTKMINVPLVSRGVVTGYVLTQFTFTADKKMTASANIKPELFVVDEAFKVIYSEKVINFNGLSKANVSKLGSVIKKNVNKRLGMKLIHDVFVRELNYLPREQFRGGAINIK